MLIKYVRNRRGEKIGVVVAIDRYSVGWSLCNFKMGDVFDRDLGIRIAAGRANKYSGGRPQLVAQTCTKDFCEIQRRALNYFKLEYGRDFLSYKTI